ncbi:MAG: fasciclin domain-containing protein, partial [Raineya sp.]
MAALVNDLRQTPNTRTADPLFAHYSTFKAAIEKTGLDELLRDNSKRFIVFAPDDLAFEQLGGVFRNADFIKFGIAGTIDANGDPVQPQYNDSLFLRTL